MKTTMLIDSITGFPKAFGAIDAIQYVMHEGWENVEIMAQPDTTIEYLFDGRHVFYYTEARIHLRGSAIQNLVLSLYMRVAVETQDANTLDDLFSDKSNFRDDYASAIAGISTLYYCQLMVEDFEQAGIPTRFDSEGIEELLWEAVNNSAQVFQPTMQFAMSNDDSGRYVDLIGGRTYQADLNTMMLDTSYTTRQIMVIHPN